MKTYIDKTIKQTYLIALSLARCSFDLKLEKKKKIKRKKKKKKPNKQTKEPTYSLKIWGKQFLIFFFFCLI